MPDKPVQTGPKLDDVGRAIVRAGVLNGKPNDEINGALVDAGYKSLSVPALWEYRRHAEIREAIVARVEEISDAAHIELGGRLTLLNTQVADLLLLMAEYGEHEEQDEQIGVESEGAVVTKMVFTVVVSGGSLATGRHQERTKQAKPAYFVRSFGARQQFVHSTPANTVVSSAFRVTDEQ